MRAAVVHETGDPSVLQIEDVPRPEPADGEVLVRIEAVGINPIDWKFRRGLAPRELPAILGSDISGTVEESSADGFAAGEPVFGFAASGAYAEYAKSPAAALAKRPAGLDDAHAAALPVAALTAWQGLFDHGGLASGQTVVITGAAGGVGHLAVQFARDAGAHVIGTASERNRDYVAGLGAEEFVDYTSQDVAGVISGADLLFDTVGGAGAGALVPALRDGGVFVSIAGGPPEQETASRGIRAEAFRMMPSSEQLHRIGELVAEGKVEVEIAHTLGLSEIARAHELSESGHTRGKIIVTP